MQALRGKGTPPGAAPEVAFVPSVTIQKDVAQTLGANFWASAAGASYDSQRAIAPPATELPHTRPAPEAPAGGLLAPVGLPAARRPATAAAAAVPWEAADVVEPPLEVPSRDAGSFSRVTGSCEADKQPATPASPAGQSELEVPKPMHAPTPSKKLAANKFWRQAAERTFSADAQPEDLDPPMHAAAPAANGIPPRIAEPQRMSPQTLGRRSACMILRDLEQAK